MTLLHLFLVSTPPPLTMRTLDSINAGIVRVEYYIGIITVLFTLLCILTFASLCLSMFCASILYDLIHDGSVQNIPSLFPVYPTHS